jgi:uncharacterized protein YbaR (Trm112 family)
VAHTDIYKREIYLGDYRIEWSDQKISVICSCDKGPELEVFSETYTVCPSCQRRYSISEIIKVELPEDVIQEAYDQGDIIDIMDDKLS